MAEFESISFDGELALQEGLWYYMLMAMDRDGNFRSIVWEDGNPQNMATLSDAPGERSEGYKNASWKFIIASNDSMTLKVESYQIYNFSEFAQ